jgi:hypothetical protein
VKHHDVTTAARLAIELMLALLAGHAALSTELSSPPSMGCEIVMPAIPARTGIVAGAAPDPRANRRGRAIQEGRLSRSRP